MNKPAKVFQNWYKIMFFCMKLTNLLMAKKIKIKDFLQIFTFIKNDGEGGECAIEEKYEESAAKLMTGMVGEKAEGTTAYFFN